VAVARACGRWPESRSHPETPGSCPAALQPGRCRPGCARSHLHRGSRQTSTLRFLALFMGVCRAETSSLETLFPCSSNSVRPRTSVQPPCPSPPPHPPPRKLPHTEWAADAPNNSSNDSKGCGNQDPSPLTHLIHFQRHLSPIQYSSRDFQDYSQPSDLLGEKDKQYLSVTRFKRIHHHMHLKKADLPFPSKVFTCPNFIYFSRELGLVFMCSRTRCVRSGVRLLIFHTGTWGFSLGEAKQRNLYTS